MPDNTEYYGTLEAPMPVKEQAMGPVKDNGNEKLLLRGVTMKKLLRNADLKQKKSQVLSVKSFFPSLKSGLPFIFIQISVYTLM